MIYVASPYTHPNPLVMERRELEVTKFTVFLMKSGVHPYSPIAYCHRLAVQYDLPRDAAFWWEFNRAFLIRATEVYVLMLDGWDQSKGVAQEIDFARSIDLRVSYFNKTWSEIQWPA